MFEKLLFEAPLNKYMCTVWEYLDASTYFRYLRSTFKDLNVMASEEKPNSCSETPKSGANDDDLGLVRS